MSDNNKTVRWAPRVSPTKLRKLYKTDALGLTDEELIDEVGFALYARCQSILIVTEAAHGRVQCPQCTHTILRQRSDDDEVLRCAGCGWEMPWQQYHRTWQHQELYAGGAADAFARFIERWPKSRTPQEKMLLIDWLIHLWHWQAREDHQLGCQPHRRQPAAGTGVAG